MTNPLITKLERYTRLSAEDRALLDQATEEIRHAPARRELVREGQRPRAVTLILSGWACRYKELPDGRRQIVGLFLPGDLCDLHVYVLGKMDHSIATLTETSFAELTRDRLEDMMTGHPRLTQALWWETLVHSAIQREWALNLGQRDAVERVAHLLCEVFLRLETVGLTSGDSCPFPVTQKDLAAATGLSSVHVNRTLQTLRRRGLIRLRERRLTITDRTALRRASFFNPDYLHLGREGAHLDSNAP